MTEFQNMRFRYFGTESNLPLQIENVIIETTNPIHPGISNSLKPYASKRGPRK
jgi:hypothetical protein